jgi:glycosyltransferase involved in cell wall biosynthesis
MRILMLNNEFPPLGGGTGVVNYYLLKAFDAVPDIWVDLVTSSRSRNTVENDQFGERINIFKVPVNNRNIHHASNRELLTYTWRGLNYSRKLLRLYHYDLSFAFSTVPAGAIAHALHVFGNVPYLVSLQGPDVPGFEARYNYLYPLLKPVIRRIWNGAAKVTAISRQHQQLAHDTMPELEIPIVYNGVDTTQFSPTKNPSRRDEVNILCVGRLIERKGQDHLLRAFANLRSKFGSPVRLTLVGTGDAEVSLKKLAADLRVANNVHFTGVVSGDIVVQVFREADVFVLPSQNEGMSVAVLEAMACGLPVVVTDTGGTAELVQENVNGFVIPWSNVNDLTEKLALLVRDQQLRHRMGNASRQTAMNFSWSAMARKYLELCVEITKGTVDPAVSRDHDSCRVVQ